MEGPLNIFIVGHDLQAKCDVANAFIKQAGRFKQFKCRSELVIKKIVEVKSRETVGGRELNIILTPNLNTPSWNNLCGDIINNYKNRVFIYVKVLGHVKVPDARSVKSIRARFQTEALQVNFITYYENEKVTDTVEAEGTVLHAKMQFKEKKSRVNSILKAIELQLGDGVKFARLEDSGNKVEESGTSLAREDTEQLDLQETVETKDWDLLWQTLRHGRAKSNHVRVNIIGNQGSGKTTLVKRLRSKDVKCPDVHLRPTEALKINEVSSRCIEIGGEKHWDTKSEGYMEDLNVQRMAQAMKNVDWRPVGPADTKIRENEENVDAVEYMLPVNTDGHIQSKKQEPFTEPPKREKSRVQYIKQILRKKDHTRGERMYVSYWDFAGQSTYYSTHQVFMSPTAVYVFVVDLSMNFKEMDSDTLKFRTGILKECNVEESLKFWISSIEAFTTDPKGGVAPVTSVGTHIDKLRQTAMKENKNAEKELDKKFEEVREILRMTEVECIAVDNTERDSSDLIALRNRILELGLGVIDEEIPAQWIDLERRIREVKSSGSVVITFADLQRIDESMEAPMRDRERLEAFLGHQHNRGHLICFYTRILKI